MKSLKNLLFLWIFLISFFFFSTARAEENGRYFIKSQNTFWKNAFNARHRFDQGFSADLNDWQLRLGKLFGLEIEKVALLQVLGEEFSREELEEKGKPLAKTAWRAVPSDQTPWGVEYVYQDPLLKETVGGVGIRVAVLDTGVFWAHPDLEGQVINCKDFTNFRKPIVNNRCEDKNGHGTHVAGIIAAHGGNDNLGIFGVAPQSSLFAFRVCSAGGSCYADDVAVAIKTAVEEGANVINLSLGSDQSSSLISQEIGKAFSQGVLVVAAGGNDGPYSASIDYPAAQAEAVAVGAFGQDLIVADWSSRGANSQTTPSLIEEKDMELAAPGVNIESTWKDKKYSLLSGTSMAAPFVSGLAAKYWSNFSSESNPAAAARSWLQTHVLDIDLPGEDEASGFGFARVAN